MPDHAKVISPCRRLAQVIATTLIVVASAACREPLKDLRTDKPALLASASDGDLEVAAAAVKRLSELYGPEGLVEAMAVPSAVGRGLAVLELKAHPGPGTIAALSRGLKDPDAGVRARSADSLGYVGDSTSLEVLRQVAESDPDDFTRRMASQAMERLRQ